MHRWSSIAIALLLAVPLVGAQAEKGTVLITDSDGDVMVILADGTEVAAAPGGLFENLDVETAGVLSETVEEITFFVTVKEIEADSETPLPFLDPDIRVYFRFGERQYAAAAFISLNNPAGGALGFAGGVRGMLMEVTPQGERHIVDALAEIDYELNVVTITVQRDAILNERNGPLDKGSTLQDIHVESTAFGFFTFPLFNPLDPANPLGYVGTPHFFDNAPDEGFGLEYTMRTGTVVQRGNLLAVAPDPVRWTNGEATTLTYTVIVNNLENETDDVRVSLERVPHSWTMAHSEVVTVEGRSSANVTILATIPFSHEHGLTQWFTVLLESENGLGTAREELAVHWPTIPQPAGHHDVIWFHSQQFENQFRAFDLAFPFKFGWMNAAPPEVDTEDQQVPISPSQVYPVTFTANGSFGGGAMWTLPLSPELRMGLDFDTSRRGTLTASFNIPVPIPEAQLEFRLVYYDDAGNFNNFGGGGGPQNDERLWVATGWSEILSGTTGGSKTFQIPVSISPEADEIPYRPDAQLVAEIILHGAAMPAGFFLNPMESTAPQLDVAASQLQLPMFEYHDPVDLSFTTDRTIQLLAPATGQERNVNPGRGVVYDFMMTYDGDQRDVFELELTGDNVEWATVLGSSKFRIDPGAERPLALLITAPDDARHGATADVTLTVTSTSNAAVQGGIRSLTTVVTDEDIPDESDRSSDLSQALTEDPESPSPVAFAIVAVAVAFVLGRRRHQ